MNEDLVGILRKEKLELEELLHQKRIEKQQFQGLVQGLKNQMQADREKYLNTMNDLLSRLKGSVGHSIELIQTYIDSDLEETHQMEIARAKSYLPLEIGK